MSIYKEVGQKTMWKKNKLHVLFLFIKMWDRKQCEKINIRFYLHYTVVHSLYEATFFALALNGELWGPL